jgi:hypothetical protein
VRIDETTDIIRAVTCNLECSASFWPLVLGEESIDGYLCPFGACLWVGNPKLQKAGSDPENQSLGSKILWPHGKYPSVAVTEPDTVVTAEGCCGSNLRWSRPMPSLDLSTHTVNFSVE